MPKKETAEEPVTYTDEQIIEAMHRIVAAADGQAQLHATGRGKGVATAVYPGEIPELDRIAAERLKAEGHEVGISNWRNQKNLIHFPGREVIRARG